MRRSIATVCLSGTLEEKLARRGARRLRRRRAVRDRPDRLAARVRPRSARRARRARPGDRPLPAVPRLRGGRRDDASRATCAAPRHKFDVMEALGADTARLLERLAGGDRRRRARRRAAAHAGRARGRARDADRLRGARLGPPRQRLRPRLADRRSAADHPALGTAWTASTSSRAARDPAGIRGDPGREDLLPPARRRAAAASWTCCSGAATTAASRARAASTSPASSAHVLARRLRRAAVARGVQRRLPPGRPRPHGGRRDALAADARGRSSAGAPRPAAPPLEGFAFVELGGRRGAGRETEALLTALGFAHTGQHRTKPVQLWQQGATGSLLNPGARREEPRGRRGRPSRAPTRRAPRARARRCSRPCSPRAAHPARPTWPRSPRPTAPRCSSAAGDGLAARLPARRATRRRRRRAARIDHVALSQPFDSFDEAALFYRSVLGLRAAARAGARRARRARPQPRRRERRRQRAARAQRARARRGGGARRARSTSPSHATTSSRPPARCASAARHCCAIPDNYYDDLAARLDLDARAARDAARARRPLRPRRARRAPAPATRAMRRRPPVLRGLERRGGYDGYGAANSPVRMAAQRAPA